MKPQEFTNATDNTLDVTDTGGGTLTFAMIDEENYIHEFEIESGDVERLRDALTTFLEEQK